MGSSVKGFIKRLERRKRPEQEGMMAFGLGGRGGDDVGQDGTPEAPGPPRCP